MDEFDFFFFFYKNFLYTFRLSEGDECEDEKMISDERENLLESW